jgi:CHAT domain-containing protein
VRARWFEEGPSPRLLAAARRAAEELEQAGWSGRAVRAHLLAGRVALELGRRADAARELDVARRARRRGPAAARLAGWHAQALHCLATGNRDAARRAVAAGLRVLDEHRASLGATELRSYAAAQADELARLGLRFALEGGRPAMVLATLERARARSLQLPPVRPPRDAPLAARLGELRAVVALGREEARAGRPSARLVRRQTELEQEIRRRVLQARGSGVVPAVRPPALRELRAALGERALIEYLGLDGRLQAIAVTPRRVRLVELGSVAEAEEEVRLLRFALRRIAAAGRLVGAHRANAAHAAVRLEAMLLAPLLDLVGDRELVIVPTGELHALPWASLPACAARPLSVAPSAALWLRALARRRPASRTLLVAGPDLPHAATEVRALAALYGDAVTLTGEDARVEPVAHALRECDRAHLACHGSFRADNPLFSALLLADGPLTVHDLESLDAAPPELVLSACDSGRAVVRAGDELMGLTSTLLAIGAGVVVASTVAVPDAPTQPLMVRLHRELLGGAGPARALATARGAAEELVARQAFLCFGAG